MSLKIKDLSVSVANKKIIHNISIKINPGETHVIMGPNGSGKTTLANALLGHPRYHLTGGKILINGKDITNSATHERASAGLFLSAQSVPEINGVTIANFLRVSKQNLKKILLNPFTFYDELKKTMKKLGIPESFATRYVNVGFSGGEKKRAEILQLLMLDPKYAILDETDAGLDVDALKIVGKGLKEFSKRKKGIVIITHQTKLLKYIKPDFVHVMLGGKLIHSGRKSVAESIEKNGYRKYYENKQR